MAQPIQAQKVRYEQDTDRNVFAIKDQEQVFAGVFAGLDEAAKTIELMKPGASLVSVGLVLGAPDGRRAGLNDELIGDANGEVKATVRGNLQLEVDVVGADNTTAYGTPVFITEGFTFDLTDPGSEVAGGHVIEFIAGTKCKVHFYSYNEQKLKA